MNKEIFIEKSINKHGKRYNYDNVPSIVKVKQKVEVICKEHGPWLVTPDNHYRGRGCPLCNRNFSNSEIFKKLAIEKYGDLDDYSKVDYKNAHTNIIVICKKHGEYEISPTHYLNRGRCPKCKKENDDISYDTNSFIKKAKSVHGNKYDYSLTVYNGSKSQVKIICGTHGVFRQKASSHLEGRGCCKCAIDRLKTTKDDFVCKAVLIHGNKYDYSQCQLLGDSKVKLCCKDHGEFTQYIQNHLKGCGCPSCPTLVSKPQQEIIDFIESLGIKIIANYRKFKYEIDIFVKDYNLAIEYHGLYWHSYGENETKKQRYYHYNKKDFFQKKNINLIQIFENEWRDKKDIIKSKIKYLLGKCENKLFARRCLISKVNSSDFNNFVEKNHLQGELCTKIKIGLFYNDDLVSVMGFNRHSKYDHVCTRFCSKVDTVIIGGASKLFKYFINNYCNYNDTILSYADRRYSNGTLYRNLGFKIVGVTKPNYWYTDKKNLFNRMQFQKYKLSNKLKLFDESITEAQNMFMNMYRRIWDAGNWKCVYIREK